MDKGTSTLVVKMGGTTCTMQLIVPSAPLDGARANEVPLISESASPVPPAPALLLSPDDWPELAVPEAPGSASSVSFSPSPGESGTS